MSFVSVLRRRRPALWFFAATLAAGTAVATLVACAADVESGDGGSVRGRVEWPCYAHAGPEPAELLDWRVEFSSMTDYSQGGPQIQGHPEVSCEVGVGIRAGWWQWHRLSSPGCGHLAVERADGAGSASSADRSQRDPIEPVLLSEGEVVVGYELVVQGDARFMAGTSFPECFLEHIALEEEPPA